MPTFRSIALTALATLAVPLAPLAASALSHDPPKVSVGWGGVPVTVTDCSNPLSIPVNVSAAFEPNYDERGWPLQYAFSGGGGTMDIGTDGTGGNFWVLKSVTPQHPTTTLHAVVPAADLRLLNGRREVVQLAFAAGGRPIAVQNGEVQFTIECAGSAGNSAGSGRPGGPNGGPQTIGVTSGGTAVNGGTTNNSTSSNAGASGSAPLMIAVSLSGPQCLPDPNGDQKAIFQGTFRTTFPAGFSRRIVLQARLRTNQNLGPVAFPINVVLGPNATSQTTPILMIFKGNQRKGLAFLTVDKVFSIPLTGPLPPQSQYGPMLANPQIENAQVLYSC